MISDKANISKSFNEHLMIISKNLNLKPRPYSILPLLDEVQIFRDQIIIKEYYHQSAVSKYLLSIQYEKMM